MPADAPAIFNTIRDGTAKHLSSDDARARELIHKTVLGSLNRATETIARTQAAGSAAWRVI